jgi:methyl coenzyme M reductase subunit C-like uncharacterized protein (methanogenesis marker protein 7)
MDNKIIDFIQELKKGYPLSQLDQLRTKLENDEFYINILELTINQLLTNKK